MSENNAPRGAQTLINGLSILKAVSNGAKTPKTVMTTTGLSKSTTHRLIQALRSEGFLREEMHGSLFLGPSLIELGFQARNQISIQEIARPYLMDMAQSAKDTIHLAVEDSGQVLYLDKIHGVRGIEIRSWPGCRMPLTYTGIGKALLLDNPERWQSQYLQDRNLYERTPEHDYANEQSFAAAMTRFSKQGYAYDLEENERGIRCVASPIKDGSGKIVAAISISAAATFMPSRRMRLLGALAKQYGSRISLELGYKGDNAQAQSNSGKP